MYKGTDEGIRKARADYQQATDIDPTYAPAWAGLGLAYEELGAWVSTLSRADVYGRARAATETALQLDDQLGEAHLTRANLRYKHERYWSGADAEFRRAFELNPRSSKALVYYANYLTAMGRFKESASSAKRAVDIDPLSPMTYNELSYSYALDGKMDEAYEQIRQSRELVPGFPQTVSLLAYYKSLEGKYEEAVQEYEKLYPDPDKVPTSDAGFLGYMYGRAGKRSEALKMIDILSRRPNTARSGAAYLAYIYLGLGEKDRCLELFKTAYENHETGLVWLNVDPWDEPLRKDPRFEELMRLMNFPR